MSKMKVISLCLDVDFIDLLDKVKERRRDQSRSNTIRTLLLQQLAEMSFLTDEEKKALGFTESGGKGGGEPSRDDHTDPK